MTQSPLYEPNCWVSFGLRLTVTAAMYPFEYAKTLMQFGYEPMRAYSTALPWGKEVMMLPNVLHYVKYIRHTDGFVGCYRGLTPKLMGSIANVLISEPLVNALGLKMSKEKRVLDFGSSRRVGFSLVRDCLISAVGVVVSQPFYVISLRMMAQFIGKEKYYSSLVDSFWEIYNQEGAMGFFAGFIPRLLYDLGCVLIGSTLAYAVNHQWIRHHLAQCYNSGFMQFCISVALYPLQVISACMSVNGSRLVAGAPPVMPVYGDWTDCAKDLYKHGELMRGAQLFWRTLPKIQRQNDPLILLTKNK